MVVVVGCCCWGLKYAKTRHFARTHIAASVVSGPPIASRTCAHGTPTNEGAQSGEQRLNLVANVRTINEDTVPSCRIVLSNLRWHDQSSLRSVDVEAVLAELFLSTSVCLFAHTNT